MLANLPNKISSTFTTWKRKREISGYFFAPLIILLMLFISGHSFGQDAAAPEVVPALPQSVANIIWLCLCGFLVFFMQAGFALVESGLTRAKNSVNIMMKNLLDFCFELYCSGQQVMPSCTAAATIIFLVSTSPWPFWAQLTHRQMLQDIQQAPHGYSRLYLQRPPQRLYQARWLKELN